jgi:hypothetical protein
VDDASVTITQLRGSSTTSVISIAPGAVFESALGEASDGVAIESDGDLVPVWFLRRGAAIALSGGIPASNE